MRSRLAFDIFHERVIHEMEESERDATTAIRQFLSSAGKLIKVFTCHDQIMNTDCATVKLLDNAMGWFKAWREERLRANNNIVTKANREFLSTQLYEDLQITHQGLSGVIQWVEDHNRSLDVKRYVQLYRVNQDFLEQYFGLQRHAGGSSQNMTAYRYGYSANAIAQSRVLSHNLRAHAVNVP